MKNARKKIFKTLCVVTATLCLVSLSACGMLEGYSSSDGADASPITSSSPNSSPEREEEEREPEPETSVLKDLERQYGYQKLSLMDEGEGLCGFYADLYEAASEFHESLIDVAQEGKYYKVAEIDYKTHGITVDMAWSVWRVFTLENPQFFWIPNEVPHNGREMYLLTDESYATATTRTVCRNAIEEMARECASYYEGATSVLERALIVHDYLAKRIDYALESDGVTPQDDLWAHNVDGSARYNAGVCETYAKTYDYLCALADVECLTVIGNAKIDGAEVGHAWNMIKLDGEWYAVDPTWGDGNKLAREWFGMSAEEFTATHVATLPDADWGINYQCELPALSEKGLYPVRYEKDGEETSVLAPTIEAAFEAMTDETASYTVYLYPDTPASETLPLYLGGYELTATATPKAQRITLVGRYAPVEGNSYLLAELSHSGAFALDCDLTIRDIAFLGTSLALNGYTLTATGRTELDFSEISENGGKILYA